MKSPTLSIILPTYNESESIASVLWSIHRACAGIPHEILVIDDHSPDGTASLVQHTFASHEWVQCFLHPGPRGLGLSILYGIKKARGSIIVGMDADGNHDPSLLPSLLKTLSNADIVVASRFIPRGGMQESFRWWTSWGFNMVLRLLGFPLHDNTSGMYAIKKHTLLQLHPSSIYYGYGDYHLRLVWKAKKKHLRIQEIPVFYGKRRGGVSKSRMIGMAYSYLIEAIHLKRYSH